MDLLTQQERRRLDDEGYLALEGLVEARRIQDMRTRLVELLAHSGLHPRSRSDWMVGHGLGTQPHATRDLQWFSGRDTVLGH